MNGKYNKETKRTIFRGSDGLWVVYQGAVQIIRTKNKAAALRKWGSDG